jgi:hypothetical protein
MKSAWPYIAYTVSWVAMIATAFWFAIKQGRVARLRQACRDRFATWSGRRCDALLFVALMVLVGALDLVGVALWPPTAPARLTSFGAHGSKPAGTIAFFAYFGFWFGLWTVATGSRTDRLVRGNSATRVFVLLLFALVALALLPLMARLVSEIQAGFR